jgi:tetratricopeptide (TPR) repeat protein
MNQHCLSIIALSMTIAVGCQSAFAQGLSEYGGSMSGAAAGAGGLHSQAATMRKLTDGNFSNVGAAIFGPGGGKGGSAGSSTGHNYPPPQQMDDEQVEQYSRLVQSEYKIALAAMQKGDFAAALPHLSKVVSTREDVWGKADPGLPVLYRQQGDVFRKLGKLPDAINAYKKELMTEGKRYGEYSPQVEKTTNLLIEVCDQNGSSQDSSVFLKKLYDIQSRPGGNAVASQETGIKLCTALTVAGDFQTAEALLRQAINAQIASKTPSNSYLAKLYECYGGLLRETNRDAEATDMEQRAASLKPSAK